MVILVKYIMFVVWFVCVCMFIGDFWKLLFKKLYIIVLYYIKLYIFWLVVFKYILIVKFVILNIIRCMEYWNKLCLKVYKKVLYLGISIWICKYIFLINNNNVIFYLILFLV